MYDFDGIPKNIHSQNPLPEWVMYVMYDMYDFSPKVFENAKQIQKKFCRNRTYHT